MPEQEYLMKTYFALAFHLVNQGCQEEPEWNRIGYFIEIKRTEDRKSRHGTLKFGEPIPLDLIVDPSLDENYFFVQELTGDIRDIVKLLEFHEKTFEAQTILSSRISDFGIKIVDAVLGPPKPPQ